ncbi:MAG: hypothetical protein R3321_04510 [Nitrososphaeraceae archaeon]|nr:hypothetical protein [Nitrososphaeraceae archaeon]
MLGNTKTSFKIGGSVGIIILLLGITLMFGVYQMSKVSNEIIQISEEYTPLYEVVSDIRFQKANQEASLEKIIRFSDTNNSVELDNAKEEFWLGETIIDSNIERAKNIVKAGLDITTELATDRDLSDIMQKLSNLDNFHKLANTSENITKKATRALKDGNEIVLGDLMNENQILLEKIGVSNMMIDKIIGLCYKYEALGSKITGAGGGGCVLALIEAEFKDNFIRNIEKEGYHCIPVTLETDGLIY